MDWHRLFVRNAERTLISAVQSLEMPASQPTLATVHEVPGHETSHDSVLAVSPLRPSMSPRTASSMDGSGDDRLQIAAETIVKSHEPLNYK
jgi:hypothetical protein